MTNLGLSPPWPYAARPLDDLSAGAQFVRSAADGTRVRRSLFLYLVVALLTTACSPNDSGAADATTVDATPSAVLSEAFESAPRAQPEANTAPLATVAQGPTRSQISAAVATPQPVETGVSRLTWGVEFDAALAGDGLTDALNSHFRATDYGWAFSDSEIECLLDETEGREKPDLRSLLPRGALQTALFLCAPGEFAARWADYSVGPLVIGLESRADRKCFAQTVIEVGADPRFYSDGWFAKDWFGPPVEARQEIEARLETDCALSPEDAAAGFDGVRNYDLWPQPDSYCAGISEIEAGAQLGDLAGHGRELERWNFRATKIASIKPPERLAHSWSRYVLFSRTVLLYLESEPFDPASLDSAIDLFAFTSGFREVEDDILGYNEANCT